jgi:hypothetical protein
MPTPRFIILATALAMILFAPVAGASQVLHQTLRDLTLGSSDIVIGQVEGTNARWDDSRRRIVTEITVRVSESLKGAPAERLILTQLGGDLDGFRYAVPGNPLFRPGEEALLFVWRDAKGRAQVNGLAQGKFEITTNAATGERTVQRAPEGLRVREARTLSLVKAGEQAPQLRLGDMLGEIRTVIAEGGR